MLISPGEDYSKGIVNGMNRFQQASTLKWLPAISCLQIKVLHEIPWLQLAKNGNTWTLGIVARYLWSMSSPSRLIHVLMVQFLIMLHVNFIGIDTCTQPTVQNFGPMQTFSTLIHVSQYGLQSWVIEKRTKNNTETSDTVQNLGHARLAVYYQCTLTLFSFLPPPYMTPYSDIQWTKPYHLLCLRGIPPNRAICDFPSHFLNMLDDLCNTNT